MNFSNDKKLHLTLYFIVLIMACSGSMITKLIAHDSDVVLKVRETKPDYSINPESQRPIIKSFSEKINIVSQPNLHVLSKKNTILNFFEPGYLIEDSIYALLTISVCLIFLIRVRRIDIERPFSQQLLLGVNLASFVCVLFAVIDYIRLYLINKHVLAVTDDLYKLERFTFFESPAFWAGVLLFWLYKIMKKAEVLQQEQDLTV